MPLRVEVANVRRHLHQPAVGNGPRDLVDFRFAQIGDFDAGGSTEWHRPVAIHRIGGIHDLSAEPNSFVTLAIALSVFLFAGILWTLTEISDRLEGIAKSMQTDEEEETIEAAPNSVR